MSLRNIVPTAQRSDTSCACALRKEVMPLLLSPMRMLLNLVAVVFNPAWRAVEKAMGGLEVSVCVCVCVHEHIHNVSLYIN